MLKSFSWFKIYGNVSWWISNGIFFTSDEVPSGRFCYLHCKAVDFSLAWKKIFCRNTLCNLFSLTVHSGGVSRGRSVAVAIACWLFALPWHFTSTSTALPGRFQGNFMELLQHFHCIKRYNKPKNCINAFIPIHQESQCLPYAGFFFFLFYLVPMVWGPFFFTFTANFKVWIMFS